MNETIKLLMAHRSIRKYADKPVSREIVEQIIAAAQMASTCSNVQGYSVVAVTDPERKQKLSQLSGSQAYNRGMPCLSGMVCGFVPTEKCCPASFTGYKIV